jgi:Uma2 family endonuclease
MVMVEIRPRQWSAQDVRALIADSPRPSPRYELVAGELLVTPSPGPAHQEAVTLLLLALRAYCALERGWHALPSPSDVELEPEDVRQPDLLVLPASEWSRVRSEGFPARALALAVEVISPGSARHDRVTKRAGYQRHVPEYWIVDIEAALVERWRSGDTRPEIVADTLEWLPDPAARVFTLDLQTFFKQVRGD